MRRMIGMTALLLSGCVTSPPPTTADLLYASESRPTSQTLRAIWDAREVVQQNLRNADTPGYKRRTARQGVDGAVQVVFDMEQGSLESSGRQFDVGISGTGFFRVTDETGTFYTRNGNFFVSNSGAVVLGLGDGMRLDPPIVIPGNTSEINISLSGVVQVLIAGEAEKKTIGEIRLWTFRSPEQLSQAHPGGTLFQATTHSGDPAERQPGKDGAGQLLQGFLEKSNVDIEHEHQRLKFLDEWKAAVLEKR